MKKFLIIVLSFLTLTAGAQSLSPVLSGIKITKPPVGNLARPITLQDVSTSVNKIATALAFIDTSRSFKTDTALIKKTVSDTAAELRTLINAKLGYKRVKYHYGNGNGTGVSTFGWTITAIGTATTANVATTNRYTQAAGIEYLVTVAATNAIAGFRETATQQFFGNSAGNGGFLFICRFGPATGVATTTNRLFVGMGSSAAAPTDVQPSTIVNQCGVGWDAADANIQFISNDGTGSGTKIDLGITVPTVDRTSLYELRMWVASNSSTINYIFTDLAQGGSTVSGSTSTDTPTVNILLAAKGWISAGGTSSVIGFGLKHVYLESNF